jgi:hypothetical protein
MKRQGLQFKKTADIIMKVQNRAAFFLSKELTITNS